MIRAVSRPTGAHPGGPENIEAVGPDGETARITGADGATGEAARNREGIVETVRADGEVLGFIAIHSSVAGRSRGGLRLLPDVGEEELRSAARAMTLKYGFLGLPQGGAKAGVLGDGEGAPEAKRERLLGFARAAKGLLRARAYAPDADLGTRAEDIRWMMRSVGVGVSRRDGWSNRSGFYTAVSCLASATAARRQPGRSLRGCRVAVEGLGSVGSPLVDLLDRRGATVVAVSTSRGALYAPQGLDVRRLLRIASEAGSRVVDLYAHAERLDRQVLLELPVDLLCPCARNHSIHAGNAGRIAAPVVCAGANDPVSSEAERTLFERGVLYPPDFVTNCGGVLGGTLEFAGVRGDRIAALVERHLLLSIPSLLRQAGRSGVPARAVAEPIALSRHARARRAAENPSVASRALSAGLEVYRRGWLPKGLVGPLARGYVERRLWS